MPAPLIWLGAAVAGVYLGNETNKRMLKNKEIVGTFPGESHLSIMPVNGAIVCCGIYEVLDHTGIWFDGKIIELAGSGLIRSLSPARFIEQRSGDDIFIACNRDFFPLSSEHALEEAKSCLYDYRDYDLIKNNCHKFVADALLGFPSSTTSFSELNQVIKNVFEQEVHWHKLKF